MVASDALIAAAYFSIPAGLLRFARQRPDPRLRGVLALFSAFIFFCGLTHVMDIWTIWQPDYAVQVLSKGATALISVATAVVLWRLIPQALKIPSVGQLQQAIESLEAEVARRRSAEEHVADLEQNLAVTLASIGAGFLSTDRAGCVTRMNSVAEQVLGWTQAQALGQSVWKVFNREDRPADYLARNPVDVLVETGLPVDEGRHVVALSRSGQPTPVEVKAALTRDEDGSVRGMAVVFRDRTRKLRGEADRGRLAAIVDSSADAIISKALDGSITSWNKAAQAMFGYSAEEAIGRSVQMLIPAEREAEEMHILAQLARGAMVPAFDTQRRARDGRLIDVSLCISPIRDAQGQIVGASKIARDISAQRAAEAALRDSEARLRFTLESAQIGDWELDLATGQTRRSARHDRCFGYETPQPDWTFDTFTQHLHPEDRAGVQRSFQDSLERGTDWWAEARVHWPDGSEHWIRVQAGIRQEDGRPRCMLGIVTDITQLKQDEQSRLLAQRLEAQNRQIQEASRLKSLFLANMSHELRTPLNAVIGFADLLLKDIVKPDSPKHQAYLGHIATSGRHLLQLINDVLDLSKVESGKFEFYPEPVQLPQLVQEVVGVLQGAMERKHLQLQLALDPTLGTLVLDPARLKQALYNYLSNAIKFTPEGGQVAVLARPEGARRWRLEVQDSGIGIAAADLPRLFREFQQLDAGYGKQHAGTGLGLALTRRLVEAQGGSVGVRSTLGQGSVFHLVLDRVHGSTASDAQAQRMLMVTGDPGYQQRLAQALLEAGFLVDGAATAEHALRQAQARPYGALTLDLLLPEPGGLELLARIRHGGASRDAPVLGLSMPAEPGSAATFPVADVLFKPIRTDEVVAALSRLRLREAARVMVVDDDPLALQLMQATLATMGITAVCVSGGRQALDAMILDLMMPGFDGFETLDALRRLPAGAQLPVFIWTSMALTPDEVAGLSRTARAILGKGGGSLGPLLDSLRHWRQPGDLMARET
jgi:PAS domain S-box-containing protein